MLLLAGLGNPGTQYARNRHNFGFMAIDAIAVEHGFSPFQKKFQGRLAEGRLDGRKTFLLKPDTYMNKSGTSLYEAVMFYKIPLDDVVVFHDELDLPAGKLRMRQGGGLAGHNGLRSIKAHLGADFRRARLGIGHPGKENVLRHTLSDFTKAETKWLHPFLDALARHAALLAQNEDATYQNRVHGAMQDIGADKE